MTIPSSQASHTPRPFPYDGSKMRALCDAISKERFATYLRLANGDRRRALQLYAHNAALGAAFYGPLQALEVTLRNGVHNAMTSAHGTFWFDGHLLRRFQAEAVDMVKKELDWSRGPQLPGRVAAALSLGFWVALFAKGYESDLWRPTLHRCFIPTPARSKLHRQLNDLRRLRNRIAHHEPILHRNLQADHEAILRVLGMLSPGMEAWVRHHSRVLDVLAQPAHRIDRF